MKIYTFTSETIINAKLNDVFAFFSRPENLQKLTPPWLCFEIIGSMPVKMHAGSQFEYKLKVHKLPIRWKTLIETWEPPFRFVDLQLKGPYTLWEHEHRFEDRGETTVMFDTVRYVLPLGIFGQIAHALFVRNDVETIFNYRKLSMQKVFSTKHAAVAN